jgi:hypothetical protein
LSGQLESRASIDTVLLLEQNPGIGEKFRWRSLIFEGSREGSTVRILGGQGNDSEENRNHADADAEKDEGGKPETEGVGVTVKAAGRAASVVAASSRQTIARPGERDESYQKEWHRSAPE